MRFLRFRDPAGNIKEGILTGGGEVTEVNGWKEGHVRYPDNQTSRYNLSELTIMAPSIPSKVIGVGLNYREHAWELGQPLPKNPIIFIKPSTTIIASQEDIVWPPQSQRVDYEAELAAVICRKGKNIPVEQAGYYIGGFTCLNDVTARDIQSPGGQWTISKSFDTFCPLGPYVASGIDPGSLTICGYLNDVVVQSSHTSEMIFPVDDLISYISSCMTLLPGDIVATGTPSGTGPMKEGDCFTVEIEGIGALSNRLTVRGIEKKTG